MAEGQHGLVEHLEASVARAFQGVLQQRAADVDIEAMRVAHRVEGRGIGGVGRQHLHPLAPLHAQGVAHDRLHERLAIAGERHDPLARLQGALEQLGPLGDDAHVGWRQQLQPHALRAPERGDPAAVGFPGQSHDGRTDEEQVGAAATAAIHADVALEHARVGGAGLEAQAPAPCQEIDVRAVAGPGAGAGGAGGGDGGGIGGLVRCGDVVLQQAVALRQHAARGEVQVVGDGRAARVGARRAARRAQRQVRGSDPGRRRRRHAGLDQLAPGVVGQQDQLLLALALRIDAVPRSQPHVDADLRRRRQGQAGRPLEFEHRLLQIGVDRRALEAQITQEVAERARGRRDQDVRRSGIALGRAGPGDEDDRALALAAPHQDPVDRQGARAEGRRRLALQAPDPRARHRRGLDGRRGLGGRRDRWWPLAGQACRHGHVQQHAMPGHGPSDPEAARHHRGCCEHAHGGGAGGGRSASRSPAYREAGRAGR